jgi:hypothetical protein
MKVKDLIEKLSKVDPDLNVEWSDYDQQTFGDVENVILIKYMGKTVIELAPPFPERWEEIKKTWRTMNPIYEAKEII